jgi:putative ABC transport system permease protein
MFVSVKERTHIIGIQKALGAKKHYIMLEVLYESGLLALIGGILGLLLIFIVTLIIGAATDFGIQLTLKNVIKGLFISAIIGFISGFAPARTAARLNPVEAIASTF